MIRPALLLAFALSALVGCGSAPDDPSTEHDDAVEHTDQALSIAESEAQRPERPRYTQPIDEHAVHGKSRGDKAHLVDVAR
jgi:hypothetical protein